MSAIERHTPVAGLGRLRKYTPPGPVPAIAAKLPPRRNYGLRIANGGFLSFSARGERQLPIFARGGCGSLPALRQCRTTAESNCPGRRKKRRFNILTRPHGPIALGRPSLANQDLVARWNTGVAVIAPNFYTFYAPGPKGYTD